MVRQKCGGVVGAGIQPAVRNNETFVHAWIKPRFTTSLFASRHLRKINSFRSLKHEPSHDQILGASNIGAEQIVGSDSTPQFH